jgi:hypothetical protein
MKRRREGGPDKGSYKGTIIRTKKILKVRICRKDKGKKGLQNIVGTNSFNWNG